MLGSARPGKDVKLTGECDGWFLVGDGNLPSFVPLCDPLAVGSYAIHLLKMLLFKWDRPKDWIDWVVEILLLICFIIAVLSVCGICLPVLVMNIATVISLTLFSAAW